MGFLAIFALVWTVVITYASPVVSFVPSQSGSPLLSSIALEVHKDTDSSPCPCRRTALSIGWGIVGQAVMATSPVVPPANAFANKISNAYDDRPKRRGPQPKDLGVSTRMTLEGDEYVGLKGCGVAPNCFSSSLSVEDDADHAIPAWTYPSSYNNDVKRALDDLQAVITAYPPGQNGVDGGGFAIQTINDRYLYVQFEALKNGYIDDFEAAAIGQDAKSLQVRSSSRVGYLDYGVNAKRLNYIASELRKRGWDAEGVDFKKHRGYAMENGLN